MKVVAFNGSPRKNGNTQLLLETVLAEVAAEGIDTEIVPLAGKKLHGCIACYKCFENKDRRCAVKDDMNGCIAKMLEADAVVIGSPTYFANVSTEVKALIDRAGLVARANDDMLRRKVGAAVVAVRRGGAVQAYNAINCFFGLAQMIVPCSIYWNFAFGLQPGDAAGDDEGIRTMKTLGQNIAWLLEKIHAS